MSSATPDRPTATDRDLPDRPSDTAPEEGPGISGVLVPIVALALLALGAGLAPAALQLWAAYLATAILGLVLLLVRGLDPIPVAAALLIASAVAESGVVPDAGRNLPTLALAIPLFGILGRDILRGRLELVRPGPFVLAGAALYVAALAVSIVPSTLAGVWPAYPIVLTVTTGVGLALGLVVLPSVARTTPGGRKLLLMAVAALGPILVVGDALLAIFGPVRWLGSWLGAWVIAEATVLGHPTGLIIQRMTGPFARPAGASTVLALSILALLALRPSMGRASRWLAVLLVSVLEVALVLTLNRDGWIILAVAGILLAAATAWQGRLDGPSLSTGLVFFALLGAISLNILGATLRPDQALRQYGAEVADTIPGSELDAPVQLRGGASLTGRSELWTASWLAIQQRPVFGWGLGSDQNVIGSLLAPGAQRFRGLTSDSTWLRMAVETGLMGLACLLLFCIAVVVGMLRRVLAARRMPLDPTTEAMAVTFVGLLIGGTFETYLLGGLIFPSFELALAAGLALTLPGPAPAASARMRRVDEARGLPDRPGRAAMVEPGPVDTDAALGGVSSPTDVAGV